MPEFEEHADAVQVMEANDDLHRLVKINEEIKKVIQISSTVNLVALNAMLIAKHSGIKSRGFAVVSSELRNFSRQLEATMNGLGSLILQLIVDMVALRKNQMQKRHLLKVNSPTMKSVLERMDNRISASSEISKRDWNKLRLQIHRILQLCESGGSLSRIAKIEAVYGGETTISLKKVANQIEMTVNEIFSSLKLLRMQLAEHEKN